jgi:hypothetical protein
MARRYDPDEDAIGDEFPVSLARPHHGQYPSAAADGKGNVLLTWKEIRHPQHDISATVFARTLYRTGALGEVVTVNQRPYRADDGPAMAMNPAGRAVFVWTHVDRATGRSALVARRYDPGGVALDDSEQELEALPPGRPVHGWRTHPSVAVDACGDITVSWQTELSPGNVVVCARRYRAGL